MTAEYRIAPSILSADFARLGDEVEAVIKSGADIIHYDVMDNHYVPNLTIGPSVCAALHQHMIRTNVEAPIDVHLMVKPVDRMIEEFLKAGVSHISFHPEATEHIDRSLSLIKEAGVSAGLVFNPATPLSYLDYVLDKIDMVLIMSVNPGFGGQKFISGMLDKVRETRRLLDERGYESTRIEIDGGVKPNNIAEIAATGVDTFVAGSAIFGAYSDSDPHGYDSVIAQMKEQLSTVE